MPRRNSTQSIDILKLYAGKVPGFEGTNAWNSWLTRCLKTHNLNELLRIRTGLQMGMSDLKNVSLDIEEIVNQWCRWVGSIDKTARKIMKEKYRVDQYDKKKGLSLGESQERSRLKSLMDRELDEYFKKTSF